MIAFGMMRIDFASSVYIVTASNPMNEKHTTVAPVSRADIVTPSWTKGSALTIVPAPAPWVSSITVKTTNAIIARTAPMSSTMLRFDVPRIDRQITVVTNTVYTTTVTHGGSPGNTCSR